MSRIVKFLQFMLSDPPKTPNQWQQQKNDVTTCAIVGARAVRRMVRPDIEIDVSNVVDEACVFLQAILLNADDLKAITVDVRSVLGMSEHPNTNPDES